MGPGIAGAHSPAGGRFPPSDPSRCSDRSHSGRIGSQPGEPASNGEFYEGGVNLTTLGLADGCFSSVASETLSSKSTGRRRSRPLRFAKSRRTKDLLDKGARFCLASLRGSQCGY